MVTRRKFIALTPVALAGATLDAGCARRAIKPTPGPGPGVFFNAVEWRTLEAATWHLLPTEENSQGAKEINAIGYLDAALKTLPQEKEDPQKARLFAAHLLAQAQKRHALDYVALSAAQKEALFASLEKTAKGRSAMKMLLRYVLEAYVGDPVHGGNPHGAVWKEVGHRPGFPRPTQKGIAGIPERKDDR